jgi:hypothetical protein
MRARMVVETLCIQILLTLFVSQAWAGCVNPPLSPEAINKFKSNPQALIAPDSDTRTIEVLVRDLAGTDALLAAALVHVAERTTPRFRTAIAAGLAQAAIACSTVDQHAALLIQQAVASFEDGQFQASFAAVAGDLSTAATAAASAYATGSAGSVVVTNPNTSSGSKTTPGGGGNLAIVQFTAPGFTVNTSDNANTSTNNNNNNNNNLAQTAASPVSSTR